MSESYVPRSGNTDLTALASVSPDDLARANDLTALVKGQDRIEAKLDRLQRDMDSVLAMLQPEAREYVSMHNAAQWPDEICGPIVSMPSTLGGNPSAFGDYQPHDDEPAKRPPAHDPNGGRR